MICNVFSWICFLISLGLFFFCGGRIYEYFDLNHDSQLLQASVDFLLPLQVILALAICITILRSFDQLRKLYRILLSASFCLLVIPCLAMMTLVALGE